VPMEDAEPSQKDILKAIGAAREVAAEIRLGGRALVTCHAGLNRSGLISAMSILLLRPKATPDTVIKVIRARRSPDALSNQSFINVLRSIWSSRVAR
jgi:protein-tyrosine phosphatase